MQRPLWASTGVKNPAYPATLYVWGLVAPDTVNTMPLPCWRPPATSGEVTGATAAEDPTADLEALAAAGIDLEDVTDQLLREGIDAFMVPMQKLLDGIEAKRTAIAGVRSKPSGSSRSCAASSSLVAQDLGRRAVGDDPPGGEQHGALAQRRGERQVVGDDQHRALDARRASPSARGACAGRGSRDGSSSTSRLGCIASTVAIATRRRWPSES